MLIRYAEDKDENEQGDYEYTPDERRGCENGSKVHDHIDAFND
jgi:hypothetical protein